LYPATLLNMFIKSKSFFGGVLGSFRSKIISSANRDNLTSPFPILIPFISFSYLTTLAWNSNTILNKSGEIEWTPWSHSWF
jgi:hypothetical protein